MSTERTARARYGVLAAVSAILFVTVAPACSALRSHCGDYCDRYSECTIDKVNVDDCEDACHDWADGNSDRESKVESCADCINKNDDACNETLTRCTADCAGIAVRK